MGVYYLGEVIKRTRESLGMTQEELSEGICTPETLSRIETGKRTPNRANFRALMERMGKCGEKYCPHIHAESYERMEEWERILRLDQAHRFEDALMELDEFEEKIDLDDRVNRQAVMRLRALCEYHLGKIDVPEYRERLTQSLKITRPDWDGEHLPAGVFTRTECFLFCNIAVSYMYEENLDTALKLMRQMQDYFAATKIDETERRVSEGLLLSNMGQCLGRMGRTEEALKVAAEEARKYLAHYAAGRLPGTLYNCAYQMEVQHMSPEDCKEKLVQAYYMAEFVGDDREKEHIQKHFEMKYGLMFA